MRSQIRGKLFNCAAANTIVQTGAAGNGRRTVYVAGKRGFKVIRMLVRFTTLCRYEPCTEEKL